MRGLGLCGAVRGKPHKPTMADAGVPRPADLVERSFSAARPNQLWVADLTSVASWSGFVEVAFVLQPHAGGLAGRPVAAPRPGLGRAGAGHLAPPGPTGRAGPALGQGSQYLSIRDSERLAEAGVVASVGSPRRQLRPRLAETMIGRTRPS
jgi:transposase InsO family protein